MRIGMYRSLLVSFFFLVLLTAIGCGGKAADAVKVEGVVTLDGKPLSGATITFYPVEESGGHSASGRTDSDGSFRLTTYRTDDGALPGEYKVIVEVKEATEGQLVGRDPKTFTEEEKRAARMGTMTPQGKKAAAEKKKPASEVPAIYRDVKSTPLREKVPPPGKIEIPLRSTAR
jgi:hypothetical protein